jgi:hypothetical protein
MAEYRWRQTSKGITAYPWGNKKSFRSAFAIRSGAAWGGGALKQAGLYRRRTKRRFPLEALYGPNINKELVKDATAAAFQEVVTTNLPRRIEHEVRVITKAW